MAGKGANPSHHHIHRKCCGATWSWWRVERPPHHTRSQGGASCLWIGKPQAPTLPAPCSGPCQLPDGEGVASAARTPPAGGAPTQQPPRTKTLTYTTSRSSFTVVALLVAVCPVPTYVGAWRSVQFSCKEAFTRVLVRSFFVCWFTKEQTDVQRPLRGQRQDGTHLSDS